MLSYLKDSETAAVVLHEIYGINQHIKDVCMELSKEQMDVFAPNMLDSEIVFNYDQETAAYVNFYNNIGFDRAFTQISAFLRSIRNRYKRLFVVGFSVGATIAWLCSKELNLCNVVVGFYGSRIRDYHEINPLCPVLLFFPTHEKSFNISDLIGLVKAKDNVIIKQLYGRHGFADHYSPNYEKQSSQQAYKDMILFMNINQHEFTK